MSVKLDTLNTKENKVSKKQYKFEPIEEINVGLLHQVVKGSSCLLYTSDAADE